MVVGKEREGLYFLTRFFCFIHKCDSALGWNNTAPNTWVSEATICTLFRHLSLCSFSFLCPSPLLSDPLLTAASPLLLPCPLDTSSVKLEQLHLQHKGFPSIPSGFQIKTHFAITILKPSPSTVSAPDCLQEWNQNKLSIRRHLLLFLIGGAQHMKQKIWRGSETFNKTKQAQNDQLYYVTQNQIVEVEFFLTICMCFNLNPHE